MTCVLLLDQLKLIVFPTLLTLFILVNNHRLINSTLLLTSSRRCLLYVAPIQLRFRKPSSSFNLNLLFLKLILMNLQGSANFSALFSMALNNRLLFLIRRRRFLGMRRVEVRVYLALNVLTKVFM